MTVGGLPISSCGVGKECKLLQIFKAIIFQAQH